MAYILTDQKGSYVMEDPMRPNQGRYIKTTWEPQASEFNYRQAKRILQTKKAKLKWVKTFVIVDSQTGAVMDKNSEVPAEDALLSGGSVNFDESMLNEVFDECEKLLNITLWDADKTARYKKALTQGLQYYDCAISDVYHAMLDERPEKDTLAEVEELNNELQEKRRNVKQALSYVEVMELASQEQWHMGRVQAELSNRKFCQYKARTDYYDRVREMLGEIEKEEGEDNET